MLLKLHLRCMHGVMRMYVPVTEYKELAHIDTVLLLALSIV
jgi:hypothetical protein